MRALSASTGVPSQSGPGDGPAALPEFVRRLVDEGTEERPLLRRAEELLAIIAHRTETVPDWAAAVGTVDELLIADAFDPASGPAGVLARRALCGRITTIAAELATAATVAMLDEIKVGFPYGRYESPPPEPTLPMSRRSGRRSSCGTCRSPYRMASRSRTALAASSSAAWARF